MKKSVYAICGAVMITIAVVLRTLAGGGGEILILLGVGLMFIGASAETPRSKGA